LPAAVSVAENNSLLAEEVWYTFRQTGIPDAQLQKLPGRPFRSADKNQFAKSILSGLKNASAQRGQWSFNITCATCHSVRSGAGEMFIGPNLANIGAASQPQYLIESVLEPSKVLKTGFQMETVETTDGKIYSGQMETKDQEIIIKRTGATPVKVPMANVKRRTTSHISPMPEGLYNEMTVRELADLTAFLLTLKGDN
jgi:putative heme-binding domain-containing protein